MGFMDKFTDIFKERSEDDFDDFYEDNSSDFEMPYAPKTSRSTRSVKAPREEKPSVLIVRVLLLIRL